jgi:hypothetical protein
MGTGPGPYNEKKCILNFAMHPNNGRQAAKYGALPSFLLRLKLTDSHINGRGAR